MNDPIVYPSAEAFLSALQAPTDDPFSGPSLPLNGTLYQLLTFEPPRAPTFSVDAFNPRWHWECRTGPDRAPFDGTAERDAALLTYLASAPVVWPCGTARVSE